MRTQSIKMPLWQLAHNSFLSVGVCLYGAFWIKSCICQRSTDFIHRDRQTTLPNRHLRSINLFMWMHLLSVCPYNFVLFLQSLSPPFLMLCLSVSAQPPVAARLNSIQKQRTSWFVCGEGRGVRYIYQLPDRYQVCVHFPIVLIAVWRVANYLFLFWSPLWFIF